MDKWQDVTCPQCGEKKVHAWYFDCDCRGNPSNHGTDPCKSCGHKPNKEEAKTCIAQLWNK